MCFILCCSPLSGCQSNVPSSNTNTPVLSDADYAVSGSEQAGDVDSTVPFAGFDSTGDNLAVGNTMSCINRNGIFYSNSVRMLYSNSNGDLLMNADGQVSTVLSGVFPRSINVYGDRIFFINSVDNKVYSVDYNGDDCTVYLDKPVLLFAVTNEFTVYHREDHALYIVRDGKEEMISDNMVLWVDFYGSHLIYTELDNDSRVMSYDTRNKEKQVLLDYGFFPAVYDDYLYYQEHNGNIHRLNLKTGTNEIVLEHWGQQFCFVDDRLYFLSSNGIHNSDAAFVYRPEDKSRVVEGLFESDGELYFIEKTIDGSHLYKIDPITGERTLIQ